jgi:hypothetical protein
MSERTWTTVRNYMLFGLAALTAVALLGAYLVLPLHDFQRCTRVQAEVKRDLLEIGKGIHSFRLTNGRSPMNLGELAPFLSTLQLADDIEDGKYHVAWNLPLNWRSAAAYEADALFNGGMIVNVSTADGPQTATVSYPEFAAIVYHPQRRPPVIECVGDW